jgi:arylsulfatase
MQPPKEWIDRYPAEWDDPAKGGKGVYRGENGYLPHDRPRAAYAAMISHLDDHVGQVLKRLDEHGLSGNTLVIFSSDNGTTHPGRDPKFHIGGCDAPFFNSTAGLRGYKGSCYEGGIRVPCVARWPGKIRAGSVSNCVSYFPDWFPTLAAVAGAPLPGDRQIDGIDLGPVLKGESDAVRRKEPMVWDFHDYGGIIAIRDGKWKALRRNLLNKNGMEPWELYDLESDPGETTDLAAKQPDVVKRLEAFWLGTRIIEPDFPVPGVDGQTALP